MNFETDDKLMAAAAQLSTEIAPERDLWPDIEARIEAPARRSNWMPYLAQAAAIVLLVGASSSITYMMTNSGPNVSPVATVPDLDSAFVSFGSNYELGQGFQDVSDARHCGRYKQGTTAQSAQIVVAWPGPIVKPSPSAARPTSR